MSGKDPNNENSDTADKYQRVTHKHSVFDDAPSAKPEAPAEEDKGGKTVLTPIAKVKAKPEPRDACMVMIYGAELGKRFNIAEGTFFIGRDEASDIHIDEEEVSRRHCKVTARKNQVMIADLGSTNGTYVNDELVDDRPLADGDLVKVGRAVFKFLTSGNIETAYHEEIYNLSTTDGLTQLHNKRYLLEYLDREISCCHRYQRALSLIILDIDHFKRVNDIFGHLAGDYVLKHMSQVIRANIRREDMMARFGGEEFVIILPEVNSHGARFCAEKVRRLIEETNFMYDGSKLPVTVSLGVVFCTDEIRDSMELIRRADFQLYEAKRQGRNRVCGTGENIPVQDPTPIK